MSKTQQEIDLEYENGGFIPNAEAFPPRWVAEATAFRATIRCDLDVSYGDHPRESLDLFWPQETPKGLMIFVHGGYWKSRSKSDWSAFAEGGLAAGWAVALIGYPLAPEWRIHQITSSVAKGIAVAAGLIDGPIAISGHSAGGHLTARMCMAGILPEAIAARVSRAVAISPLSDMRPFLRLSWNDVLRLDQTEAEAESPILGAPLAHIEVTSLVGGAERPAFLDHAKWLAEAWDCAHMILPKRHHFDIIDPLRDPRSEMMSALLGAG